MKNFVEKNKNGKEIPDFYATITPPKVTKGIIEIEVYVISLVCRELMYYAHLIMKKLEV